VSDRDAVEVQLPRLSAGKYRITSSKTTAYNCFAWAAKDTTRVWSPVMLGSGVYWPPGIPALPSLTGVVDAYTICGFEVCTLPDPEEGYEKIAIFATEEGEPRHAARQLPNGAWTSKLGDHVDIEHDELELVGGAFYGEPSIYMRRATRNEDA
jgi:hypothetical protein